MRKTHRTLPDISLEERIDIAIIYSQSESWPNTDDLCGERNITPTTLKLILEWAIREEKVDLATAKHIADAAATHAYCNAPSDQKENARERSWNHYSPLIAERERREQERQAAAKAAEKAAKEAEKVQKAKEKEAWEKRQIKLF